ncbi:uncharacterized protein LOC113233656 [Hyposmocoma kahamanoa]|uniref:uncharacterized protein LOC113233656 n=1 Tax=Hyposmocoma kahamanoa TaxID=1477025 RepID=UPI000E6D6AAA|nr:uncharacterized protein LOC113233656 [Hyposmocoma kahamanoa]
MESEDLENVPLVRMSDVQPDRSIEYMSESHEVFETCIIDGEYDQCVVEDEESNIGSMVSIKSEDVNDLGVLIVSENIESAKSEFGQVPVQMKQETDKKLQKNKTIEKLKIITKPNHTESWPTLEILPGGVINLGDKNDHNENLTTEEKPTESGEMMYACAKCSQSFKYLFCLVKHVKWHEEEAKKGDLSKLTPIERKILELNRRNKADIERQKTTKIKLDARLNSDLIIKRVLPGKRKVAIKPKPAKVRKVPKK